MRIPKLIKKPGNIKRTFTVNRANWARGSKLGNKKELNDGNYLMHDSGEKCCLGFISQQCGVMVLNMLETASMSDIEGEDNKYTSIPIYIRDNEYNLADINDEEGISEKTREIKLKNIARKGGYDFKFIGPRS